MKTEHELQRKRGLKKKMPTRRVGKIIKKEPSNC